MDIVYPTANTLDTEYSHDFYAVDNLFSIIDNEKKLLMKIHALTLLLYCIYSSLPSANIQLELLNMFLSPMHAIRYKN